MCTCVSQRTSGAGLGAENLALQCLPRSFADWQIGARPGAPGLQGSGALGLSLRAPGGLSGLAGTRCGVAAGPASSNWSRASSGSQIKGCPEQRKLQAPASVMLSERAHGCALGYFEVPGPAWMAAASV